MDYGQWLGDLHTVVTTPISWVTDPEDGVTMKASLYTVRGVATALVDIDWVEVSLDGGVNWHLATGTNAWSYEWLIPGDGTYTILSRVIDLDGVIEVPGAGNTVTIDSSLPTTAGTLYTDETWTGEVDITGDITVPEGVTLTLSAGTVVRRVMCDLRSIVASLGGSGKGTVRFWL